MTKLCVYWAADVVLALDNLRASMRPVPTRTALIRTFVEDALRAKGFLP